MKSLRAGRVQLKEAYVFVKDAEAFLFGAHISALPTASTHVIPDPIRTRKLLLNRSELNRLVGAVERRGYTLVPLELYWKNGRAKLRIGLAKGKKEHDKRATSKDRDWQREKSRLMKHSTQMNRNAPSALPLPATAVSCTLQNDTTRTAHQGDQRAQRESSCRRSLLLALGLLRLSEAASLPPPSAASKPAQVDADAHRPAPIRIPRNWLTHGRTYSEQRFSPLAKIDARNVKQLGLAWFARPRHASRPGGDAARHRRRACIPRARGARCRRSTPRRGKLLWQYDPQGAGRDAA